MNEISLEYDPIVAIATATGQGGIGVVRISLGRAGAAAAGLMQAIAGRQLTPRQASYVPFHDVESGDVLDRGIALHFPAPHSYTGETVLEFQGHGGPVVMQLLLRSCLAAGRELGLRLADPGEFTRRAFLNDKLDLAQAEAVADLIEASTEAAARSASRSLAGAFSARIEALVDELIDLRMLVEATLDFPEEEIDFLEAADARGRLARVIAALHEVRGEARQGALLRDGLTVVLAGQPNVGKSSLLNALAGAELAIVTPIAGTTRDRVEQTIQIDGIPLHIVDTAGLRETNDEVEKIGIARSWQAIEKADVVLHLLDRAADSPVSGMLSAPVDAQRMPPAAAPGSAAGSAADREIAARLPDATPVLRVVNKIDLTGSLPARRPLDPARDGAIEEISLSARTGDGIALLRAALLDATGSRGDTQGVFIARERHLQALAAAATHLDLAAEHAALRAGALDLFAEELRLAQQRLGEITGAFTSDDLLGVIFSRFCIGK